MVYLLFAALPFGAAAVEISTAVVVAGALFADRKGLVRGLPLLAVLFVYGVAALGGGSSQLHEAIGKVWPWVLMAALPCYKPPPRAGLVGLAAAAVVGCWGLLQFTTSDAWAGGRGPFSHHLTLGYALVPALAWGAAERRWWLTVVVGFGIASTGATGPALAALVALMGLALGPGRGLLLGLMVALVAIAFFADPAELHIRSLLWASGAAMAEIDPLGVGPDGFRTAAVWVQHVLEPGFFSPGHAHDSSLQWSAMAGWGAWIAWAWVLLSLWQRSGVQGRAALAGLVVGSLTQDTLGDLEVVRALCAWMWLSGASAVSDVGRAEEGLN